MSGVNRLRVTPRIEFGLWPPLRASSQTTVVIAIAPTAAAMIADFLCCLILLTMYSALDVDLPDSSVVCRSGISVPPDDATVVSISAAPPIPCLTSFNSRATSRSFSRQRRITLCTSGGANGLKSLIDGAGSYATLCKDLITDSSSNGLCPVTASKRMQPNEKMSER